MKSPFLPPQSTALYYHGCVKIACSLTQAILITEMFTHSEKQNKTYSQPDVEIKEKSHLIVWEKSFTTELCAVGKIVLNSSYAECNRDTQGAVHLHALIKGRKNKAPRHKANSAEAFQHKFCPRSHWGYMYHYWEIPTLGWRSYNLTFFGRQQSKSNGITAIQQRLVYFFDSKIGIWQSMPQITQLFSSVLVYFLS